MLGLYAAGHVDLPGPQRRRPRHLVLELDDLQFVGVGLAGLVVVLETAVQRTLAGNEALEPVGASAHRVGLRVVIGGHYGTEADQGFVQGKEALALFEADFDGALIELAQGLAIDGPHQPGKGRSQLRVGQAQDGNSMSSAPMLLPWWNSSPGLMRMVQTLASALGSANSARASRY